VAENQARVCDMRDYHTTMSQMSNYEIKTIIRTKENSENRKLLEQQGNFNPFRP
jgi:hypothetical protein